MSLIVEDLTINVTTKIVTRLKQSVGTSEESIKLGEVATPGFVMLVNLDATNYIEVKTGTGGTVVGKMFPGECYGPVRLGSGMTAPFVIANTGACQMEVLVISP